MQTSEWISQINNTSIKVNYGDIFNQKPYKVIAFNEYFDTIADDNIITQTSLNGIYINKYVEDIEMLNKVIWDQINTNNFVVGINKERRKGKEAKCKLGSVIKYNDFLLLAFSRFDEEDKAFLTRQDYYNCLGCFWKEVDRLYAGYQVSIPLLGSGMTRTEMSEQELLVALIETFKSSKVRLAGEGLNIVLHDTVKAKVNYGYKLHGFFINYRKK